MPRLVSVPLRGLSKRKAGNVAAQYAFIESVSVPLRGLSKRKVDLGFGENWELIVSVPLRGLSKRKVWGCVILTY